LVGPVLAGRFVFMIQDALQRGAMDFYEHFAIVAFRSGDREPLSKWLKEKRLSRPLSEDLCQLFQELVDGKTGRPRGEPLERES